MVRLLSTLVLLAPAALAAQIPFLARPSAELATSVGSHLSPILNPDTDDWINDVLKTWKAPGVAVAVVRMDDEGVWKVETKGYGIENHKGKQMTEDSLFNIASNSKLFTAVATGLLVHNDSVELRWDSKMKDVVPGWKLMDEFASDKADLKDMLAHRSGLPRHDMMAAANDSIESIVSRLQYLRPSVEFRQKWQYNNIAYMLAAKLPYFLLPHRPSFASFLQEHIFSPLGMSSTSTSVAAARNTGHMCDGFTRANVSADRPSGDGLRALPYWMEENAGDVNHGAGGVITSVKDISVWMQMLLLQGRHPETNETVVLEEVIAAVEEGVSVQSTRSAWRELSPAVYGAGCATSSYRGHRIIEHGGSTPGFLTQILRLPDEKAGVAVFVNDDIHGVSIYQTIKFTLLDRLLNLSSIDWSKRYLTQTNQTLLSQPTPTPRPSNATSPDLSSLAGSYHDPAYGTIELCVVSSSPDKESKACAALRKDAPTILPGAINASSSTPTLLAHVNKVFTSHLRLTHFDGAVWNVTELTSQASLTELGEFGVGEYGSGDAVVAEFDGGGFGVTGGFWGAGEGVADPQAGKTVRERSEVWFERV